MSNPICSELEELSAAPCLLYGACPMSDLGWLWLWYEHNVAVVLFSSATQSSEVLSLPAPNKARDIGVTWDTRRPALTGLGSMLM